MDIKEKILLFALKLVTQNGLSNVSLTQPNHYHRFPYERKKGHDLHYCSMHLYAAISLLYFPFNHLSFVLADYILIVWPAHYILIKNCSMDSAFATILSHLLSTFSSFWDVIFFFISSGMLPSSSNTFRMLSFFPYAIPRFMPSSYPSSQCPFMQLFIIPKYAHLYRLRFIPY